MAILLKSLHRGTGTTSQPTVIDQWIQISQPLVALPASTTGQLFRVKGGRIRVRALIGQVTTVIQAQACNVKVSSKALDTASVAIGTAVDVASNLDVNAVEAGGMLFVEGDGTALVKSTAGASLSGTNTGEWVAAQGEIYITTDATNTGKVKWDLWYLPLDAGAFVEAAVLSSGILTAAI